MKQLIIKSATIILFSSLLIVYIAFRSGYFGGNKSNVPVSPNGSALNNQIPYKKDTNNVSKMDSATLVAISSKSMVIADEANELISWFGSFDYQSDSTNKSGINLINKAEIVKDEPELIKIRKKDSIKRDSFFKLIPKKRKINTSRLSSSKSLIMAPDIIEVLKRDSTVKDSLIKK